MDSVQHVAQALPDFMVGAVAGLADAINLKTAFEPRRTRRKKPEPFQQTGDIAQPHRALIFTVSTVLAEVHCFFQDQGIADRAKRKATALNSGSTSIDGESD